MCGMTTMSEPAGYSASGLLAVATMLAPWAGLYRTVEKYPEGFAEMIHDYVAEEEDAE